jgi:hypothetical protein
MSAPIQKTGTEDAWEELCAAAEKSHTSFSKALAPRPTVHPFAKLGEGPWRFEGLEHAPEGVARHCALCGKRIKNLYIVSGADRFPHSLGSECVLGMSNGFEGHLVGQVKTAKKRFEKNQRAAREARKIEAERKVALEATEKNHASEAAWLRAYSGNFDFYLSLQRQLSTNGGLSPRQWECVTRAIEKAALPKPARTFSLAVGEVLIVTKFFAHIIGKQTGLTRPHFAVEVVAVEAETEKAYKVQVKLSAQRTSHCCVCGKTLTNPRSVAAGIGPICGGYYEVDNLEALAEKLRTVEATANLWIPKGQIKERKKAA